MILNLNCFLFKVGTWLLIGSCYQEFRKQSNYPLMSYPYSLWTCSWILFKNFSNFKTISYTYRGGFIPHINLLFLDVGVTSITFQRLLFFILISNYSKFKVSLLSAFNTCCQVSELLVALLQIIQVSFGFKNSILLLGFGVALSN